MSHAGNVYYEGRTRPLMTFPDSYGTGTLLHWKYQCIWNIISPIFVFFRWEQFTIHGIISCGCHVCGGGFPIFMQWLVWKLNEHIPQSHPDTINILHWDFSGLVFEKHKIKKKYLYGNGNKPKIVDINIDLERFSYQTF